MLRLAKNLQALLIRMFYIHCRGKEWFLSMTEMSFKDCNEIV
jgi:hypothetical protein